MPSRWDQATRTVCSLPWASRYETVRGVEVWLPRRPFLQLPSDTEWEGPTSVMVPEYRG